MKLRNLPTRLATGAFVLNAGLGKWKAGTEQAAGIHGMAAAAIPPLAAIEPPAFIKLLSAGEVVTGALLLAPFVSNRKAGLALTAFSGGLMALYARTPVAARAGQHPADPAGHPGRQGHLDARHRPRPAAGPGEPDEDAGYTYSFLSRT